MIRLEKYWSQSVRLGLMSRNKMPYIASLSSMSNRSTAPKVGNFGHAKPRRIVHLLQIAPELFLFFVERAANDAKVSCVAQVPP